VTNVQATEETTLKTVPIITLVAGLFGAVGFGLAAESGGANAIDPNRLEPCMNGEVSATGRYPTQAEEDAALAEGKRLGQASASTR